MGTHPPGGIAGRVIAAVPAGLVLQPDTIASTGPTDLARAAGNDGGPDAAAVLAADEFIGGYERLWRAADGRQLLVSVEEFATRAGAEDELRRRTDAGLSPRAGIVPVRVPAPDIPGAVELASPRAAATRILLTRGRFLALVSLVGPPGSRPPAGVAGELARAEYRLLA